MVKKQDNYFLIETKNLLYVFHINEVGYPVHDYFGNKIVIEDFKALGLKQAFAKANAATLSGENFHCPLFLR